MCLRICGTMVGQSRALLHPAWPIERGRAIKILATALCYTVLSRTERSIYPDASPITIYQ